MNLGNPGEITMLELAEKVRDLAESRSALVRLLLPVDDLKQRQPEIELARKVMGWEPKVSLEEGLKKNIAYVDELLGDAR